MSTSSSNPRTYGRHGAAKRQLFPETKSEEDHASSPKPRKRRKLSTDGISDHSTLSSISKEHRTVAEGEPDDSLSFRKGSVSVTYGSPRRLAKSSGMDIEKTPSLARDLTRLFESTTPTTSTPPPTPSKLAKRMLSRSKTDSSLGSQSSPGLSELRLDRTPSLPNLSASSSSSTNQSSSTPVDMPSRPQTSIPTTTRTYAGKSRSFLIAIPASSLAGSDAILPPNALLEDEDESLTRESYSSLRSRWGVDDFEDDELIASPSRSEASATPSNTPSRSGKRRSKANRDAQMQSQPLPQLPNGMMNPLKSITELRSKGESRRFLDEVGYLFEGMAPNCGAGLRRASALEIVTRLCDSEFFRKAKAADFLSRTWDVFLEAGAGKGEDKVLDILLAFFTALVAKDPACVKELAQRPSFETVGSVTPSTGDKAKEKLRSSYVELLFYVLSIPKDPLVFAIPETSSDKATRDSELRKIGLNKRDFGTLTSIYNVISTKSGLFLPDTPISIALLVMKSLQSLPPSSISTTHLPVFLESLRMSLLPLLSTAGPTSHIIWSDAKKVKELPFECIGHQLRLLDLYLLGQWHSGERDLKDRPDSDPNKSLVLGAQYEWLVHGLTALGICAELEGTDSSRQCIDVTLRVLVTLTHEEGTWGQKLLDYEYSPGFILRIITSSSEFAAWTGPNGVKKEDDDVNIDQGQRDEEAQQSLDRLCLALALLTNLVQSIESTKDVLREISLSPTCKLRKHSCIRKCTCSGARLSALDILVRLYRQQSAARVKSDPPALETQPGPDTMDASFLRGHLAVLFGLLMRGSRANQTCILSALRRTDASLREKAILARLANQARDFVAFYTALHAAGQDQNEERTGDAEHEVQAAKQVLLFLEELRDSWRS